MEVHAAYYSNKNEQRTAQREEERIIVPFLRFCHSELLLSRIFFIKRQHRRDTKMRTHPSHQQLQHTKTVALPCFAACR